MGDSCSCLLPVAGYGGYAVQRGGGREGTHTSCSPFQIQKWRTDGAAAEKKRRIDNDSDVLRAFQLSPPPIPLFLPAHAAPSEQR